LDSRKALHGQAVKLGTFRILGELRKLLEVNSSALVALTSVLEFQDSEFQKGGTTGDDFLTNTNFYFHEDYELK